MIESEIILDSLNPQGDRLTTWILKYPRFVHAELMTHRVFSKNSASSRAIPIEKMIQEVIDNPAMPVWWGKNQSGMQANEELNNNEDFLLEGRANGLNYLDKLGKLDAAKKVWLQGRDSAIEFVRTLNKIGLHKQIANRILEPWFNIKIILSGTNFDNWFALRAHKDAQPEIRALAYQMLDQYNESNPNRLKAGDWHIPFGDGLNINRINKIIVDCDVGFHASENQINEVKRKIAVARCARISYLNFEGKDDYEADIKLCDRLFASNPKHLSPTEHVAEVCQYSERYGNFVGFKQYRYFFPDQCLKDPRVKKYGPVELKNVSA